MLRSRTLKLAAALSCVIPAAAVIVWSTALWPDLLLLIWTAAAAGCWIAIERREHAQRMSRSTAALQQSALRTLNHHRHDWMNDLQILYGYIRMNKPDKTVQSVEKIRERMAHESRIAKLGVPSLVLFLQSFRTITNALQLDVFVEDGVNLSERPVDGAAAAQALVDALHACRMAVKPAAGEPARLEATLAQDDSSFLVTLRYEGEWKDENELRRNLEDRLQGTPLRLVDAASGLKRMQLQAELHH